ncbi:MAG TPA: NlpC/P60 family protein [Pirellulales bacterium]|jgi:hypothetical protein|nr:NlpC/P60 family protein [Pirellulales bacterium]
MTGTRVLSFALRGAWALAYWLLIVGGVSAGEQTGRTTSTYQSPYSVQFTLPLDDLIGDLKRTIRGDYRQESSIPFPEWYTPEVRSRYGVWGPPIRHYPAPEGLDRKSLAWMQQRVIAVAAGFQGHGYQHHHVPDWDPPAGWPWKEVKAGHNGKGVDCSNFTAFVYNLALGIKMTGAVEEQSKELRIEGPGTGRVTMARRIEKPSSYDELAKTLQTGDLLFVHPNSGRGISHVVLWVGPIGRSPDGAPLVIDSHGEGVEDSRGTPIPAGVHLRPYRDKSWYFRETSHVLRILNDSDASTGR